MRADVNLDVADGVVHLGLTAASSESTGASRLIGIGNSRLIGIWGAGWLARSARRAGRTRCTAPGAAAHAHHPLSHIKSTGAGSAPRNIDLHANDRPEQSELRQCTLNLIGYIFCHVGIRE